MRSSVVVDGEGGTLVVSPVGYVDLAQVLGLRRALVDACRQELPVVVDLSRVTALDATALGVLVAAHRRLRSTGCSLTVVGAHGRVLRTMQLTGVDRVLLAQG